MSKEFSHETAQKNMISRNWEFRQGEQLACKKMSITQCLKMKVISFNETE